MVPPLEVVAVNVQDMMATLKKLRDHGLTVEREQCHLLVQQVKFCGHILPNGTRRATPNKLEAVICSLWDLRLCVRNPNTRVLRALEIKVLNSI